jgi:hypothetical protein
MVDAILIGPFRRLYRRQRGSFPNGMEIDLLI